MIDIAPNARARIIYRASVAEAASADAMIAATNTKFYASPLGVSIAALEAPLPHIDMSHIKASGADGKRA